MKISPLNPSRLPRSKWMALLLALFALGTLLCTQGCSSDDDDQDPLLPPYMLPV